MIGYVKRSATARGSIFSRDLLGEEQEDRGFPRARALNNNKQKLLFLGAETSVMYPLASTTLKRY